jgi:hypothetical protein
MVSGSAGHELPKWWATQEEMEKTISEKRVKNKSRENGLLE